jgi:preprotein translocase subunit SecA
MNKHREIIYRRRNNILENDNLHERALEIIKVEINKITKAEVNKNVDSDAKKIIKNINSFL